MSFTDLPKYLSENSVSKSLKKNEYLVEEGRYVKSIAFIKKGFLRSYQTDFKGVEITTNLYSPFSFCGSFYSFYSQQPALENIVAITNVELKLISYDRLMALYKERLDANILGRKFIENVCIQKDIRISKMLKLDAKERYLWFMEQYPQLILNIPIKYIASYLGMSKETISRIRKKIIN